MVDPKSPSVFAYHWCVVGFLIGLWVGYVVYADFGTEGEPGVDDNHLDRPRYVRIAQNGSMLVSDHARILEVSVAGDIVWQVPGTFCDITWLDSTSWAALNGTSTSACDQVLFSNGTVIQLPHQAQRIHPAGPDLVIGAMHRNITRISRSGALIKTCELVTGYISDLDLDHYLYDGTLYSYNLTSCSSSITATPPGDSVYSFQTMPNSTFAYGVGWNNGSRQVVWGSWTTWISSFPEDLAWNGSHLAVADLNAHVVRVWKMTNDTPPPPDGDGDGVPDATDPCPEVWGNATDVPGCPDQDGDGVHDAADPCPLDPDDLCVDLDGDGYNLSVDDCPSVWGNSTVDRLGCPDDDGDGVSNLNDPCPDDPLDRCNQTPTDPGQLVVVSYSWTITNRSAELVAWLNDTATTMASINGLGPAGAWSGTNPYQWATADLEANTTYLFGFVFTNATNTTWLNITDTTMVDPDDNTTPDQTTSWDPDVDLIETEFGNETMWFNFVANETVVATANTVLHHEWYTPDNLQFQLTVTDLTPNTTYLLSITFRNHHNGSRVTWLNFTTRDQVYPWPDGDGGGGHDDPGPGLLDTTPAGVPMTVILLSVVAFAGLSTAILIHQKPEEIQVPRGPPGLLADDPFLRTDELEELEADLPGYITEPFASPDLFADVDFQPPTSHPTPRAPALPLVPVPDRQFIEAPSLPPGRLPYLAIQVAGAEDLDGILENLAGRLAPRICEENKQLLKDVQDLEKRLRQLRDDRDIAPRKYEQLLREVEDLKKAVQQLTPLMERRDWDV